MRQEGTFTEEELATLWGVYISTIYGLRRRGELKQDGRHKRPQASFYYTFATLNAFYVKRAQNLHVDPPTMEAIIAGDEQLHTIAEAVQLLDEKPHVVTRLIELGELGKIDINPGRVTRIPASEIQNYKKRADTSHLIDRPTAAQLLCVSLSGDALREIVQAEGATLDEVEVPNRRNAQFFTRDSVDALLERLLHGQATIEEWRQWILVENQPVFSVVAASEFTGLSQYTIRDHILAGELVALRAASEGLWRIPRGALEQLQRLYERYEAQQLAELFNVSRQQAQWWLATRSLCKRKHAGTRRSCPNGVCMKDVVRRFATLPDVVAADWLAARECDPEPLLGTDDLKEAWRVTDEVIDEALKLGILDGILLPAPYGKSILRVTHASALMFFNWRDRVYAQSSRLQAA